MGSPDLGARHFSFSHKTALVNLARCPCAFRLPGSHKTVVSILVCSILNMLRAIKLSRLQGEHKSKTMVKPSSNPTPPETSFSPLELLKLGCSSEALHHDLATKFFSVGKHGNQGATLTAMESC